MSPKLKPLLLPQLVEERCKTDSLQLSSPDMAFVPSPYALATTNSSSSDITSPVTPTFSTRGHVRYSSSTSSIDIPHLPQQENIPTSPLPSCAKQLRQLPDVQEEPMEREEYAEDREDNFGLYNCLCDVPCEHRNSSDDLFPIGLGLGLSNNEFDLDDYDAGFLSDGAGTADNRSLRKKRSGTASPLTELTSRLSSRFGTIRRWRSSRRSTLNSLAAHEFSLDNVLSGAPSSRSSSVSRHVMDRSVPPTPALPYLGSAEDISRQSTVDLTEHEHTILERDRAMATTPLLPPLMTNPLGPPPADSPLQSPTIEPSQNPVELQSPALSAANPVYPVKPSLSTRPSTTSLRQVSNSTELQLPIAFPGLPDYDEWSDRLGHANFTITPQPYEPSTINAETVTKFRDDYDAARVNYTKHLVRTGENYGQTSKIYGLTEAKWAEAERRWRDIYDGIMKQTQRSAPGSKSTSRSRSRGRGRGRSMSATGGVKIRGSDDDVLAGMEWRRLEECLPSAVPQMLEALDAEGKFPGRGDEDIVGPMQRDAFMAGAYVEDARSQRFWKNLAGKVGLR